MASPTTTGNSDPLPTCRQVIEFLMAYIDGELSPDQRHTFDRHMSVCPSCVNYMESYKKAVRLAAEAGKAADSASGEIPSGVPNAKIPDALFKAIREARKQRS